MPARPNILFIHVDELRFPMHFPRGIGSADEFLARFMPHTHRLLWQDGVKFSRYYTAAADCTAGRGTFVTGLYAQQTNLMVIRQGASSAGPQPALDPRFPTYGKLLRECGYDTPYIGKWHLSDSPESPASSSGYAYLQPYGFNGLTMPDPIGAPGQGIGTTPPAPPPVGSPYAPSDADIARQAIEWLTSRQLSGDEKPFCLTVGFVNPHDKQWFWGGTETKRFRQTFEEAGKSWTRPAGNVTVPSVGVEIVHEANPPDFGYELPANWQSADSLAASAAPICTVFRALTDFACGGVSDDCDEQNFTVRQSLMDENLHAAFAPFRYWTRALDMYTQAMLDVDEQIGQLLENVPDELMRDLVIVFTADHGEYASSHGLQGKGVAAYEETMRVPLIVRSSRFTQYTEVVREQLASHVDLLRLFMDMANDGSSWMTGEYAEMYGHRLDLLSILRDPATPGRPYAAYTCDEHFIPLALDFLHAPEHVIGLALPKGKLAAFARWLPGKSFPLFSRTDYYDYDTEGGRLELDSTPESLLGKAAMDLLVLEVLAKEIQAPLPARYHAAQQEALAAYWHWVELLDAASVLLLKVGAP